MAMQREAAMPAVSDRWSDDVADLAARAVVVVAAFNLNGLLDMAVGASQIPGLGQGVSIVMLAGSAILVWKYGLLTWFLPFTLLMGAIAAYLVFGTVISEPMFSAGANTDYYRTYGGSMLLIWAVAGYTMKLGEGPDLVSYLQFVRNCFLVAAGSILASPILYDYVYARVPPSYYERMGGFFENPNEAGFVACLALVLVLAVPFRRGVYQWLMVLATLVAVALPLSKGAITAAILLLGYNLVRRIGPKLAGVLLVGVLVVSPFLKDAGEQIESLAESAELSAGQRERILSIGQILRGKLDSDVSTGRTEMWQIGVERAWDRLPFGSGLGSFHHMRGGIAEGEVWMGAHNTFLMFWGEGGVPAVALLLVGMLATVGYGFVFSRGAIEVPAMIVLVADMMGTHGALGLRYHNFALGLVLGLLCFQVSRWRLRAEPAAAVQPDRPRT